MKNNGLSKLLILVTLFWPLFILSLTFVSIGAEQPRPLRPERHEVKVRLVIVDAIVTKDGQFVIDLTKDDFEIYEDGVRMPINSFELISFGERRIIAQKKEIARPSPEVAKKQLVVIFDGLCSFTRSLKQGARKIVDGLVSMAKIGNEVMIVQLSEKRGLEILQPFTTNEQAIRRAMVRASGTIWMDRSEDALALLREAGLTDAEIGEMGVPYSELVKPFLEEEYLFYWRRRFEKVMGGLLAVANIIKEIPGRKSMLLISDGFPELTAKTIDTKITEAYSGTTAGTTSGARTPHLDIRKETDVIRIFDPFNILQKKKNLSAEEVIREFIRFANAHNISVYSLDPETWMKYLLESTAETFLLEEAKQLIAFRQQDRISRVQNLRWLAEDTGGASFVGSTKYQEFTNVLTTDLNYYYQLSYYPPRKEPDNAYHKIEVKVKRSGCDVRARKGYTDYSADEERRLRLVSAFYSPELFKDLPFKGDFAFFYKGADKFEPWINLALPTRKLLLERAKGVDSLGFILHVWVKSKSSGERSFGGQINLPFKVDDSFQEMAASVDYLCLHYKANEMPFAGQEYEAIFALQDNQTNEIGTWTASLSLPDLKRGKEASIFNFITGVVVQSFKAGKKAFNLVKEDGALEYGELRFYPTVTNGFGFHEEPYVFLQAYLPNESNPPLPQFSLLGGERMIQSVEAEIIGDSWDKKAKVWSALINLNLQTLMPGDYTLKISLLLSSGVPLTREVPFTKMSY